MAKILHHSKKELFDSSTGEVTSSEEITERWLETEPDYIKLYIRDLIKIKNLPKGTSNVLFCLLQRMGYTNDIAISAAVRRAIGEELTLADRTIKKGVEELIKAEILIRKDRGLYMFNPFLFGRGKWHDIKKIRMTVTYENELKKVSTTVEYQEQSQVANG